MNQLQRIQIVKEHSTTLAFWVAMAIGSGIFVWTFVQDGYQTYNVVIAGGIALIVFSFTYMCLYAALMRWPHIFPDGIDLVAENDDIISTIQVTGGVLQMNRANEIIWDQELLNDSDDNGLPVMFEEGGSVWIRFNKALYKLDEDRIKKEHIELIHMSKPVRPSENALNDIGISRWLTTPPNAKSVISWLTENGFVSDGAWTAVGKIVFGIGD